MFIRPDKVISFVGFILSSNFIHILYSCIVSSPITIAIGLIAKFTLFLKGLQSKCIPQTLFRHFLSDIISNSPLYQPSLKYLTDILQYATQNIHRISI